MCFVYHFHFNLIYRYDASLNTCLYQSIPVMSTMITARSKAMMQLMLVYKKQMSLVSPALPSHSAHNTTQWPVCTIFIVCPEGMMHLTSQELKHAVCIIV